MEVFSIVTIYDEGMPDKWTDHPALEEMTMKRKTLPFLLVAVAAFCHGVPLLADSSAGGTFQSSQIGANTFVSSPKGEVYLVFNNDLFRNMQDDADSWDKISSGIKAIALDPRNEKVIYGIDRQNHVIKSTDAGHQWLTLNTGIPNLTPLAIYVNPVDSQEVFIGSANGLFKTTDAGFTWRSTSFLLTVNQIFLDPHTPANLCLLSAGSIFVSSDTGNTWRKSETGLPSEPVRGAGRTATKINARVSLLISVDWQRTFLLAATSDKGVFRSDDGGGSWKPASAGLDMSEPFITAALGNQRIALCSADHIYRSTDGTSWTKINIKSGHNTPVSYVGAIEYPKHLGLLLQFRFPQDREIPNVGKAWRVGFLDANDVLVGRNYGVLPHSQVDNVWTSTINGKPALFAITANLFHLDQAAQWSRPTFIYVSTDNGYSWELLGKNECGDAVTKPRGVPSDMWVYGNSTCITRSQDGGVTWERLPGVEFKYANGQVLNLRLDPKNHDIAYYSAGVNERYLFRYQYHPETKQGQALDLKTIATNVLVDESHASDLFTDTAQLSTDGGWTWSSKSKLLAKACKCEIGSGYLGPVKLISLRGGEIRVLISYGGDWSNSHPGDVAIMRSQDLGDTWSTIAKFNAQGLRGMPFVNSDDSMNVFIAVLATKVTPLGSYRAEKVSLLETHDGGASWKEIYSHGVTGGIPGEGLIRGVAQVTGTEGRVLLLATSEGLLRSEDDGKTWNGLGGIR